MIIWTTFPVLSFFIWIWVQSSLDLGKLKEKWTTNIKTVFLFGALKVQTSQSNIFISKKFHSNEWNYAYDLAVQNLLAELHTISKRCKTAFNLSITWTSEPSFLTRASKCQQFVRVRIHEITTVVRSLSYWLFNFENRFFFTFNYVLKCIKSVMLCARHYTFPRAL